MNSCKEKREELSVSVPGELIYPFGWKRYLKKPKAGFDMVPVLDMIVLGLLLSLLFTHYLISPGVQVDLPKTKLSIQQDGSKVEVLTIASNGMLFFKGGVYEQTSIEDAFLKYFTDSRVGAPVLLLKAKASMDIQQFLDLCKMAQDAGFSAVQIAADTGNDHIIETKSGQNGEPIFPAW